MQARPPSVSPAQFLPALGRLTRGLSAIFWGLPIALVVCVQTARTDLFAPLGIVPPVLANGLLLFGLWQLGQFQPQERVWRRALDRTQLMAVVNVGLAPFLYWWKMAPSSPHYRYAIFLLALSGLVFVFDLNQALQRLAAMLPDETLRLEAGLFTTLNLYLILLVVALVAAWSAMGWWRPPPDLVAWLLAVADHVGLVVLLLLVLLPLALTMTLTWKIKEVVLASVFAP